MIITSGPEWANGCSECTFGLALDAPIPRNGMTLAEVRRMQYREGIIAPCECEAGQAYERWLKTEPQPPQSAPPSQPARPPRRTIGEMSPEHAAELRAVYA